MTQKFYCDHFFDNRTFSSFCGLSLAELNYLEEVFLEILDFDIMVSEQEYSIFSEAMENFTLDEKNYEQVTAFISNFVELVQAETQEGF